MFLGMNNFFRNSFLKIQLDYLKLQNFPLRIGLHPKLDPIRMKKKKKLNTEVNILRLFMC